MTRFFHASRRFDPSYSPLGRLLRRWTGDRRRAEALHILIGTGLTLVLIVTYFVAGTLLAESGGLSLSYSAILLGMAALLGGLSLAGVRPSLAVVCRDDAGRLDLKQGAHTLTLSYAAIESVQRISALRFHRHERRYAATHVFIGHLGDEVLLLRTERGPVVIGLDTADDQATLADHLETARAPARTENALL